MSAYVTNPPEVRHAEPFVRRIDDKRGSFAMWLFIATEATLFAMLFFTYYYVEKGNVQRWSLEEPPKLHYSLPMLGVLWTSSVVLHWGEKQLKKGNIKNARWGVFGTIFLGLVFLVLTYFEYAEHLLHLSPRSNAYGSIFYTITGLHASHVTLGVLMLTYLSILPRWEPAIRVPHRPYHDIALYWHFVDTVWFFIIGLLYLPPNIYNWIWH